MNRRLIAFYCEIISFALMPYCVQGQKKITSWAATNWTHSSRNCHHLLSAPAQCKWDFFEIKGSLEGTIIAWDQVQKNDKIPYAASVAILNTGKETIRVLLLRNYSTFRQGQHIKILPGKEPDNDVMVPLDRDFYLSEEKRGAKPVCRINRYDDSVLKTTWGRERD